MDALRIFLKDYSSILSFPFHFDFEMSLGIFREFKGLLFVLVLNLES